MYTAENDTFDLKAFTNELFRRLPENQQSDDLYQTMENHVKELLLNTVRNLMTLEELDELMKTMDKSPEKAHNILSEYMERNVEIQEQFKRELDHFESLIPKHN